MSELIRPDYSKSIRAEGETYLLDPRYDFIRVFPWLKMGILNVITETGVQRLYTTENQCYVTKEYADIPLVEMDFIVESENETMRKIIADSLDDSWLE